MPSNSPWGSKPAPAVRPQTSLGRRRPARCGSLGTALVIATATALASARAAAETWDFDVLTSGEDVTWMSPTNVDPTASIYVADYVITLAEVHVMFLIFEIGPIDVTDQIPPDFQTGSGTAAGPAPIEVYSKSVAYPPPPEPAGLSADLTIGLDADGFGYFSASNVALGMLTVDLGPPFGTQTVTLLSMRLVGQLQITAIQCLADLDGDGAVGAADLAVLLGGWGPNPGHPADLDVDGTIGAADLAILLGSWGPCQ